MTAKEKQSTGSLQVKDIRCRLNGSLGPGSARLASLTSQCFCFFFHFTMFFGFPTAEPGPRLVEWSRVTN